MRKVSYFAQPFLRKFALLVVATLALAIPAVSNFSTKAVAAAPTGLSVVRDTTTGVLTASWSASGDAGLIGYKIYIKTSGSSKSSIQSVGLVTSTKICYPFTGNTTVYLAIRTNSVPDPDVAQYATSSIWASYAMGGLGSVPSSCATNTTTQYTYSVAFDSNTANSGVMATLTGTGYSVTLPNNAFVKTSSTFSGWNTQANGLGTGYSEGQTINLAANLTVTLYAQWTTPVVVTFYKNDGGAPETSTQTLASGVATNLTLHTFNYAGHEFAGWNTQADGLGATNYTDGQSVTLVSPISLYAKWASPVLITFYKNDTTTSDTATQSVGSGAATALTLNTFSRTGYTFAGWNTQANGLGATNYTNGQSVTISSPLSIYAKWTLNANDLFYDGNGSDGGSTPSGGSKNYGATVTVASNTFTRSNYSFASWNTQSDGNGTSYNPDTPDTFVMPDADVTLYAIWTANAPSPTPTPTVCQVPVINSVVTEFGKSSLPYFYVGGDFKLTVNGLLVTAYSLTGQLPPGLIFDAATGVFSGTLTAEGLFNIVIKAKNSCGEASFPVNFDVDKETPNAISCRFDFSSGRTTLTSAGLKNLKDCVSHAKEISPKKLNPQIIFTGGALPSPTDPTGCDTANERYQAILDAIADLNLSPDIAESLFNGSGSQVEIIFIWIRPSN